MTADRAARLDRAAPEDLDELVALVDSAYRGDESRRGWTTEADLIDGQRVDATMLAATLRAADTIVLVRRDGGSLVGCCELRRTGDDVASFGMFAIRPVRQGEGLGHEILAAAERVAVAEWGTRVVTMSVIEERSELIAWYRRRGYIPTGEHRPFPYGDERFGRPRRDDLQFVVLSKALD